jgi:hypothetical protein
MSQDDGKDSSLEKTLEELNAMSWPSPGHPDLPYVLGASAINFQSADNAESPELSIESPPPRITGPDTWHFVSQAEGNNLHSAQADETLPQPQQDIGTGVEPSDNAAPDEEKDIRPLLMNVDTQLKVDDSLDVRNKRQYPAYVPVIVQTGLHEDNKLPSAGPDGNNDASDNSDADGDNDADGRKVALKLKLVRLKMELR